MDAVYKEKICGGTLVGSKYVITAAQCLFDRVSDDQPIPEKQVKVRIGDNNLDVNGVTNFERTVSVSKIRNHPKYKYNQKHHSRENDISILELAEEVDLNIYTPVCLAQTTDRRPYNGEPAQVFGWGEIRENDPNYTKILRKINVKIVNGCGRKSSLICAGAVKGQDWCHGDEGGPLTHKSDGQHILIGVVSYGYGDCADAEVRVCMN